MPGGRGLGLDAGFASELVRAVNARVPALTARQAVHAAGAYLGVQVRRPVANRGMRGGPAREGLLGDGLITNVFVLGYSFQSGLLPVGLEALERPI